MIENKNIQFQKLIQEGIGPIFYKGQEFLMNNFADSALGKGPAEARMAACLHEALVSIYSNARDILTEDGVKELKKSAEAEVEYRTKMGAVYGCPPAKGEPKTETEEWLNRLS